MCIKGSWTQFVAQQSVHVEQCGLHIVTTIELCQDYLRPVLTCQYFWTFRGQLNGETHCLDLRKLIKCIDDFWFITSYVGTATVLTYLLRPRYAMWCIRPPLNLSHVPCLVQFSMPHSKWSPVFPLALLPPISMFLVCIYHVGCTWYIISYRSNGPWRSAYMRTTHDHISCVACTRPHKLCCTSYVAFLPHRV